MAKNTTATQSLTKKPASRGKSDAAPRANRRRDRVPEKRSNPRSTVQGKEQVPGASSTERRPTKQDQLVALLLRDEGATIAQMIDATGWLPHTVRAALTGLKKKGYAIDSDKVGDVRTYRATGPQ